MSALNIVLTILQVLSGLALTVIVLMQSGKSAGLSGSIPLQLGSEKGTTILDVTYQVSTAETIFHPVNLGMCLLILITMPLVNYAMHPASEHTILVDPALLVEEKEKTYTIDTPAEKIEHSKVLWFITLLLAFSYIVYNFAMNGFNLSLNIVTSFFWRLESCSTAICANMLTQLPAPPAVLRESCSSSCSMRVSWD